MYFLQSFSMRMYPRWNLCTLYLYKHTSQVRVTVGNSGLCCCACVMYFEHKLTSLRDDSVVNGVAESVVDQLDGLIFLSLISMIF